MYRRFLLLLVAAVLGRAQTPALTGFGNPAGTNTYAPGSQAHVIGKDLANATVACSTSAGWPTSCSDTFVVFFDNNKEVLAALSAVSPGEVRFQIPIELPTGMIPVTVARKIGNANVGSTLIGLQLDQHAPGLLRREDGSGNSGQFLDDSNTPIQSSNPANPGDPVSVIAIGLGPTNPQAQTGRPPTAALPTTTTPTVTVAGLTSPVIFSILIPGQVGMYQVKFRVPANVSAGDQPVELQIGGKKSNTVLLPVRIRNAPVVQAVVNAATGRAGISSGTWFSVFGSNLSATARAWRDSDFTGGRLPTALDGVSIIVNGKSAAVSYISSSQINAQAPADTATGSVAVVVRNSLGEGTGTAILESVSPGFFVFSSVEEGKYLAAVHPDGVYVGKRDLFQGAAASRPAKTGDVILLFGTGFGSTDPAVPPGQIFSGAAPLANPGQLTIRIGDTRAEVQFVGLVGAGLYQFNVTVPRLAAGDHAVIAEIAGVSTQTGKYVTVE